MYEWKKENEIKRNAISYAFEILFNGVFCDIGIGCSFIFTGDTFEYIKII